MLLSILTKADKMSMKTNRKNTERLLVIVLSMYVLEYAGPHQLFYSCYDCVCVITESAIMSLQITSYISLIIVCYN